MARAKTLTRRGLLALGGVAGAGLIAGAVALESHSAGDRPSAASATPTPSPAGSETIRYVSTDLTTSKMTAVQSGETAEGVLLVQPQAGVFNGVIMDNRGEPFWIAPTDLNLTDLRVQTYQGKPVLTYWSGKSVSGHGDGACTILDSAYRTIATVQVPASAASGGTGVAGSDPAFLVPPGIQADLHEFHLTPQGTALVTAFPTVRTDLSSVGGPSDGYVLDCRVCEIDIATGSLLFDWSALTHIPLEETYASVHNSSDADGATVVAAFDAYHLNSIDFDDENRLYVSSRHTHTVYCIDRATGDIIWRMGGKASDFEVAEDARFAWQHHVRKRANSTFSMFDNHSRSSSSTDTSRGLLLNVDEDARTVTRQKEFTADVLSIAMGSMDLLDNGNWVLGWGTQPLITEHRPDGKIVLRVDGLGTGSYRGFRQPWVGTPVTVPDVAARAAGRRDGRAMMAVYASWNGATEVRNWRILTGPGADQLTQAAVVARNGFETRVDVASASFAAVQALAIDGSVLGTSAAVRAA